MGDKVQQVSEAATMTDNTKKHEFLDVTACVCVCVIILSLNKNCLQTQTLMAKDTHKAGGVQC